MVEEAERFMRVPVVIKEFNELTGGEVIIVNLLVFVSDIYLFLWRASHQNNNVSVPTFSYSMLSWEAVMSVTIISGIQT